MRARLANGVTEQGDLLVAANGFRSTVRSLLMPATEPVYAGYAGWRGLTDEAEMVARLGSGFFARFGFDLACSYQMVGYPVAGVENDLRPGHRRYTFVWYRPVDDERLRELLTDASGQVHGFPSRRR
ncbi:hypothetical protein [Roseomonas fluvialis]|uniref:2,6-dihydroxypyridine 3-monooxygenase substrate binding domain-containing protein n=1 Tax=Roseomonas fluvialis TaxID=1750527 RepID=A0ABM7XYI8_9PROT|nr:hypothetical protein [Roseomonas fluvialis]BDG70497.1 hypothetical protein Rmf_04260 [Roseomonas fluvialis]